MSTPDFLSLLHVALGGGTAATSFTSAGGGGAWVEATPDSFLVAIAALLVEEAERILRMHVARGYLTYPERRTVISGRPLWTRDFGRHPAGGITCLVNELSTDTVHNRIVLQGLLGARKLLENTSFRERVDNQVFIWRTLASAEYVQEQDFIEATVRGSRLTTHYSSALSLSRAITLGSGLADMFAAGGSASIHFELSLPGLFEQLIIKLLEPLQRYGLQAKFKSVDSGAFLDGCGDVYRNIEPDITIWCTERPVAVIDAKFKPRYMRAQADGSVSPADRVSNEDLYQLFFYQSRLQALYKLSTPPAAFVVAPLLSGGCIPALSARTIQWRDTAGRGSILRVEGIDFSTLSRCLKEGASDLTSAVCPALVSDLVALSERPSTTVAI